MPLSKQSEQARPTKRLSDEDTIDVKGFLASSCKKSTLVTVHCFNVHFTEICKNVLKSL